MREPVVHKTEAITVEYVPNGYKGPLAHRELDITDTLKFVVDVEQDMEIATNEDGVRAICHYSIRIQEKKNGVHRPYKGQAGTQFLTDRFKTNITNMCFAVMTLTNLRDKNEPALYQILLRVEIDEPMDATFTSVMKVVY